MREGGDGQIGIQMIISVIHTGATSALTGWGRLLSTMSHHSML